MFLSTLFYGIVLLLTNTVCKFYCICCGT